MLDLNYYKILESTVTKGSPRSTRSGEVISTFSPDQWVWYLNDGYPILSARELSFHNIMHELLWFMDCVPPWYSNTNIKYLLDNNVNIWNDDAYRHYRRFCLDPKPLTKKEYIDEIKNSEDPDPKLGDMGKIYGHYWKPQLRLILELLKHDPTSRRMVISCWDSDCILPEPFETTLPACHYSVQFYVHNEHLHLKWTQRSIDVALGLPYNIASYALLCHIVAHIVGLTPGKLILSGGDFHIYENQREAIDQLLDRSLVPAIPQLEIVKPFTSLEEITPDCFKVNNYKPHPKIKLPLSVGV